MNEENHTDSVIERAAHNRLFIFVFAAVVVAVLLVSVSMTMYTRNGTAQVDLTRQTYQSIDTQPDTDYSKFDATGALDKQTLKEFREMYVEQSRQVTEADGFRPGPLGDSIIGL